MLNTDSYLQILSLLTRFAVVYNEGTYGSGSYNEGTATSPASQPTPVKSDSTSPTTSPVVEAPATTDKPTRSTTTTPHTTQPAKQPAAASESFSLAGMDPIWSIAIATTVITAALITVLAIIVKKLLIR